MTISTHVIGWGNQVGRFNYVIEEEVRHRTKSSRKFLARLYTDFPWEGFKHTESICWLDAEVAYLAQPRHFASLPTTLPDRSSVNFIRTQQPPLGNY
jgi:hypothetical protein